MGPTGPMGIPSIDSSLLWTLPDAVKLALNGKEWRKTNSLLTARGDDDDDDMHCKCAYTSARCFRACSGGVAIA